MNKKIIKLRCFMILPVIFALNTLTTEDQVIHKKEIQNFVGVIKTTSLSESNAENRGVVKEENFTKYYVDLDDNRYHNLLYTPQNDSTFEQTVAYLRDGEPDYHLKIDRLNTWLVILSNGLFETSCNYLTIWKEKGDSLKFEYIHNQPIEVALGRVKLTDEYTFIDKHSLIFILHSSGGDAGYVHESYSFMYLNDNYNIFELVNKGYESDEETQSKKLIFYEFIDNRTLLTDILVIPFTVQNDDNAPTGRSIIYDRDNIQSQPELFDLFNLIQAKIEH